MRLSILGYAVDRVYTSVYTLRMTTTIQKWGNSLGLRIPKEFARRVDIREGSSISFLIEKDTLILKRSRKQEYTLDGLLRNFDKKSQHKLVDWGSDVGTEVIPR